jgi:molybdopterin synthase catalytic subunit
MGVEAGVGTPGPVNREPGTGSRRVALVSEPIEVSLLLSEVASPTCGASSVFLGTVRDVNDSRPVSGIDYSAYDAMAVNEMHRIVDECAARFGVERIVIEHRLGFLALGEVSVAIVVAHPHREPALDAMRYLIEELKKRVPIWKREHYVDGTREWIDPSRRHAGATS